MVYSNKIGDHQWPQLKGQMSFSREMCSYNFLKTFLSVRFFRFISPFGRFYEELKEKSSLFLFFSIFYLSLPLSLCLYLSPSLSLYISLSPLSLFLTFYLSHSLSLFLTLSFTLSLLSIPPSLYLSLYLSFSFSFSPSLSLLSIIFFGVSNGRFRPCFSFNSGLFYLIYFFH